MRSVALGASALVASLFAFALPGCAAPDEVPPPPANVPSEAVRTKTLHDVRGGLAAVLLVADACRPKDGRPADPGCEALALDELERIERGGAIAPRADVTGTVRRILSMSWSQLCRQARIVKFVEHPYFAVGGYFGAGIFGTVAVGVDLVWDLDNMQTAAFYYTTGGVGNLVGGGGGVYGAFAGSDDGKLSVVDAWSGTFFALNASIAIPETSIGLDVATFTGAQTWRGREIPDPSFRGSMAGLSVGINLANIAVLTVQGTKSGYKVWPEGNAFLGLGYAPKHQSDDHLYWIFDDFSACTRGFGSEVCRAATAAAHLVTTANVTNGPAWIAALGAVLKGGMRQAGFGYDQFCSNVAENLPSGECSGMATASHGLGPRTCAGTGDEEPIDFGLEPSPPTPVPAPATTDDGGDCALDPAAACADGQICSKSTRAAAFCCRTPSDATRPCWSDDDCDAKTEEVCAQLNDGSQGETALFGCTKPASGCVSR